MNGAYHNDLMDKDSIAVPYKIHGYSCRCGAYTDAQASVDSNCSGCGKYFRIEIEADDSKEKIRADLLEWLDYTIKGLNNAERMTMDYFNKLPRGAREGEADEPEGAVYIQISDTLAKGIVRVLTASKEIVRIA